MTGKLLREANVRRRAGESALLRTTLRGETGSVTDDLCRTLEPLGKAPAAATLRREGETLTILEPVPPRTRLLILGGGHISLALSEMAAGCGFSVTVADDRPDFAAPARFPWAEGTVCADFPEAVRQLRVTGWDYVVVLTRGHAHDGDCLHALLDGTAPAYLGMIGSRRRVAAQLRLLEAEGYPSAALERICTPVGLAIGAVTPAEIAVSILAQLIARRRQGLYAFRETADAVTELQGEVLDELAACTEPMALITVLESVGSTPRGAGAKMAVTASGRLLGTVGGGCAERTAVREAARLIGSGRYAVRTYDMTGDVAEREGMACGGSMTVLLEDAASDP